MLPARGCDARKCIKPLASSRWTIGHYRKDHQYGKVQLLQFVKKFSEVTEEELEAFASALYENLMAEFAQDIPTEVIENT